MLKNLNRFYCRHARNTGILCFSALILLSANASAATDNKTSTQNNCDKTTQPDQARQAGLDCHQSKNTAYVDSVYSWGPWGLDVEPAAGGIHPSVRPLIARTAKIRLRTDSTAAIAPVAPGKPPVVTPPPTNTAPPSINTRPYQPGESIVTGTPRR